MRITDRQADSKSLIRGLLVASMMAALVWGSSAARASETSGDRERETVLLASSSESTPDAVTMEGNASRGRLLFLQCRACHSLDEGGINKVGPNLYGVFGSAAGNVEGFEYSEALVAASIVWSPATLDAWLTAPSDLVPGNRMIFTGLADPQDRADLIAYLLEATAREE
ncbi:MAG: cytochrome c [Halieaceae bacterium]|jgi:cytochrome c